VAEGREAIDFYQRDCKKSRIRPLRPFTLEAKVQRLLSYVAILFDRTFDQSNELSKEVWVGLESKPKPNPNYDHEDVNFFN